MQVYASKNKNNEEQKSSSSGGIFSAIANYVLKSNGVVYGCAFDENLVAEHTRIDSVENLYKLKGSKYVQSNTKNTYVETKNDLEKNRIVLYSGTPCQIAGLYSYLGKEYENLITIDLICHGVPSPKLFKKYKEYLEQKNGSKVVNYDFRNKEKNIWGDGLKISFDNGRIIFSVARLDSYNQAFYNSYNYRECCYSCKYSNINRIGDITLGDYWGIKKVHPDFYDDNGISSVIINTFKGKMIYEKIKEYLIFIESDLKNASYNNKNLVEVSNRSAYRDNIYKNMDDISYKKFAIKNLHFKKNIKDIIKSSIPFRVKQKIKKIFNKW